MNTTAGQYSPNILGGALRKGLQSPEPGQSSIQSLDGPSRAAIVLMPLVPKWRAI